MSTQETNRDGLPPGQPVDYDTWARIENRKRKQKPEPVAPAKPRRKKIESDDSQ